MVVRALSSIVGRDDDCRKEDKINVFLDCTRFDNRLDDDGVDLAEGMTPARYRKASLPLRVTVYCETS